MGLPRRRPFLFCFLLLVLLTCTAEGRVTREKRDLWKSVGSTLALFKTTLTGGVNSIFQVETAAASSIPATTTTTTTTTAATTSLEEAYDDNGTWVFTESRHMIEMPIRCPLNHVVVRGRCRMRL